MAPTSVPFVIEHEDQALLLYHLAKTFPGTRPSTYLKLSSLEFQFDLAVAAIGWQQDREQRESRPEEDSSVIEW